MRPIVGVRMSEEDIERVDKLAEQTDVKRSEYVRRLVAYGLEHMPRDWKP